jgi:hypothetical protein
MLHPDSGFFLILQVNTRETYRESGKYPLRKCSMLSVDLFFLMSGGSGLPSPDTAARKKYVTSILLVAMLEG